MSHQCVLTSGFLMIRFAVCITSYKCAALLESQFKFRVHIAFLKTS